MRSSSAWLFSRPTTSMRAPPWAMELEEVTPQEPCFFSSRSRTPGHGGGAEVVQGDDEGDIPAAAGDAGVADHGVDAVGVSVVQLLDGLLPALPGGQVGVDVAALEVDVDHLVALLLQNGYRPCADAAGAAGHYIDSHVLLPPLQCCSC